MWVNVLQGLIALPLAYFGIYGLISYAYFVDGDKEQAKNVLKDCLSIKVHKDMNWGELIALIGTALIVFGAGFLSWVGMLLVPGFMGSIVALGLLGKYLPILLSKKVFKE